MAIYKILAMFVLAIFGTLNELEASTVEAENILPPYDMIVIYGVPDQENEDVLKEVNKIGQTLGFGNYSLNDILGAYRSKIPKFLFPKPIIVHMVNSTFVHKWAMAFNSRIDQEIHKEPWHILVNLPTDADILKEEVEDWAKKRKFAKVFFAKDNITVLYQKSESSPHIYEVQDMNHLHRLLSNDFRHEVPWSPVTKRMKIDINWTKFPKPHCI
ncbi:hypothetical protein WDU94_005831 [Cyamophila willieti]